MSSWMFLPQFLLPNFLLFTLEVEMHGIEKKGEGRGEGLGGGRTYSSGSWSHGRQD